MPDFASPRCLDEVRRKQDGDGGDIQLRIAFEAKPASVASLVVAEAKGSLGAVPTAGARLKAQASEAVATEAPAAQAVPTRAPTFHALASQVQTSQAVATQALTAQAVTTQPPRAVPIARVPPAMAAELVGPPVPRQRHYRARPSPAHQRERIPPPNA